MLEFDEQDAGLYSASKTEINDAHDGRPDGDCTQLQYWEVPQQYWVVRFTEVNSQEVSGQLWRLISVRVLVQLYK
jgi:hypothetical protein